MTSPGSDAESGHVPESMRSRASGFRIFQKSCQTLFSLVQRPLRFFCGADSLSDPSAEWVRGARIGINTREGRIRRGMGLGYYGASPDRKNCTSTGTTMVKKSFRDNGTEAACFHVSLGTELPIVAL